MNDNEILLNSINGFLEKIKSESGRFIYLYRVKNLINGKIYIGVRSYIGKDPDNDKYIGSGISVKKNNELSIPKDCMTGSYFYNSLKKYGVNNFEKKILLYFNSIKDALECEKKIVNEEFLKSGFSLNKIIGGGMPPTGSGKENNNYGNFWTDEMKFDLSNKIKNGGHSKGGNNVKAKVCYMFDLLNDKEFRLNFIHEAEIFVPGLKDVHTKAYIIGFQYYIIEAEFYEKGVEFCIENFGSNSAKKVFKLIKLYKTGQRDSKKLSELTELKNNYIQRFLKNIKYESINN